MVFLIPLAGCISFHAASSLLFAAAARLAGAKSAEKSAETSSLLAAAAHDVAEGDGATARDKLAALATGATARGSAQADAALQEAAIEAAAETAEALREATDAATKELEAEAAGLRLADSLIATDEPAGVRRAGARVRPRAPTTPSPARAASPTMSPGRERYRAEPDPHLELDEMLARPAGAPRPPAVPAGRDVRWLHVHLRDARRSFDTSSRGRDAPAAAPCAARRVARTVRRPMMTPSRGPPMMTPSRWPPMMTPRHGWPTPLPGADLDAGRRARGSAEVDDPAIRARALAYHGTARARAREPMALQARSIRRRNSWVAATRASHSARASGDFTGSAASAKSSTAGASTKDGTRTRARHPRRRADGALPPAPIGRAGARSRGARARARRARARARLDGTRGHACDRGRHTR